MGKGDEGRDINDVCKFNVNNLQNKYTSYKHTKCSILLIYLVYFCNKIVFEGMKRGV